ncbi:hypothetical protein Syun_000050 [Stephania yunnanensis]|uniref:EGF-like calcium-binding domain-containing protein n=1 Tax=Stephania yunnanensis TaxID=152371 RepID=A0AAP0LE11_9MAGN
MRERLGFVCLIWFAMVGSCLGRFVVEKNSLRVTSPDSLKDVYECAIGNFGVPQYGGTMIGTVVYPKANQKACKDFSDVDVSFKSRPGGLPTFVLADRGGFYNGLSILDCFFTLKAWNAQKAGAAAILVADDRIEPLITMDTPEEDNAHADYLQNITIPAALVSKTFGDSIKKALSNGDMVNINLDWREALPHPDERVEYEFWTNSNDECGPKCESQIEFVRNFKGAAQILEQKGYTQFTPHYITWYCAPDPEQDFSKGYDGKDVVVQNLRQVCVFKIANEHRKPWLWWDYVTDFAIRCPMKEKKYTKDCADQVIKSLDLNLWLISCFATDIMTVGSSALGLTGLDLKKIDQCIGDPEADVENPVLKAEQDAQLDKGAVLRAICAGFRETTEPAVCLADGIETNECLENNGGCWHDKEANITACKDTFRGRVCECPIVEGVKFVGDGYTACEGIRLFSFLNCMYVLAQNLLYADMASRKAQHPETLRLDFFFIYLLELCVVILTMEAVGSKLKMAELTQPAVKITPKVSRDVDECKDKLACQCPQCKCKNTWGSYECGCSGNMLYMREHDTCIGAVRDSQTVASWSSMWIVILVIAAAGVGGYAVYKYRIRRYMDSEIRAIMAQYMPLDNQGDIPNHIPRGDI